MSGTKGVLSVVDSSNEYLLSKVIASDMEAIQALVCNVLRHLALTLIGYYRANIAAQLPLSLPITVGI